MEDQVFWRVGHPDSWLVLLANEVCDSSWLTELESKYWSEQPLTRPGWKLTGFPLFYHPKSVSTLDTAHSFTHPRFAWSESPLLKEGILKMVDLSISQQGSMMIRRETLLPFLTIVDTRNKLAQALVTILPSSIQRARELVLIHLWKFHLKYPGFILG